MLIAVCGLALASPEEPMHRLPQPHYERLDSDPDWLAYAAQFHGHLGPWATAGTRLGMAGLREIGAEGHFDVEVICEGPFLRPPKSCFLDGLQVATGATLGKRNLYCGRTPTDEIVVRLRNTRTGALAEVRPTPKLVEMLGSFKPRVKAPGTKQPGQQAEHDHDADRDDAEHEHAVEALARRIATLPDREILIVSRPEQAKHHE
jgi:formylmethanofuran dehydrogenase subunit E